MQPLDDEALHLMEHAFIDGFRSAPDKQAFLLLARVPLELQRDGAPDLKLVEVAIDERYEVGTAHPGFGSRELVHHALPGALVKGTKRLRLVYVSATERRDLDFAEVVGEGA